MASGFYHVPHVPLKIEDDPGGGGRGGDPEKQPLLQPEYNRRRRYTTVVTSAVQPQLSTIREVDESRSPTTVELIFNDPYALGDDEVFHGGIPWMEVATINPVTQKALLLVLSTIFSCGYLILTSSISKAYNDNGSDHYIALVAMSFWTTVVMLLVLAFCKIIKPDQVSLVPSVKWTFLLLGGLLHGLHRIMLFSSVDPSRTNPRIQMALFVISVPFTALSNLIVFRFGVNCKQVACLLVLLAGIFVTSAPVIFPDIGFELKDATYSGNWEFALMYTLSWIPSTLWAVLAKKVQHKYSPFVVNFFAWDQVLCFCTVCLFFWVNLIPGVGRVKTPGEFVDHISHGLSCLYGGSDSCSPVSMTTALTILFLLLATLTHHSLLCSSRVESLVLFTISVICVAPVGVIFWMLFESHPTFHWDPVVKLDDTVFVAVGLIVIIFAGCGVAYFENIDLRPRVYSIRRRKRAQSESSVLVPRPRPRRKSGSSLLNRSYDSDSGAIMSSSRRGSSSSIKIKRQNSGLRKSRSQPVYFAL